MRNLTIYLALSLCFLVTKMTAQESFETRARAIADKIEAVNKEEKAALKVEVEAVNTQLESGSITKDQADRQKAALAEARATIIETKVNAAKEELNALIQEKVDGKVVSKSGKNNEISFGWKSLSDTIKKHRGESRNTTQLVFAFGANNLVTDGALAHSDFGYARSTFYEWGLTNNYRLSKTSNLLHLKYGFSWMYNMLKATDNRYFVDAGDETVLATYPTHLRRKDSYFKNVYVTVPVHLEFDFTKTKTDADGKQIFRSHEGFRFGLGGFVGYNTNSKQFLSYEEDDYRIIARQKGNWNVNDWTYGVSAYIGYGQLSLYAKYDLNPMFKNNTLDQNNISMGARFDFN